MASAATVLDYAERPGAVGVANSTGDDFAENPTLTRYILQQLAEADAEAADPNTHYLTHEEVMAPLRQKYAL